MSAPNPAQAPVLPALAFTDLRVSVEPFWSDSRTAWFKVEWKDMAGMDQGEYKALPTPIAADIADAFQARALAATAFAWLLDLCDASNQELARRIEEKMLAMGVFRPNPEPEAQEKGVQS